MTDTSILYLEPPYPSGIVTANNPLINPSPDNTQKSYLILQTRKNHPQHSHLTGQLTT
jgi:hypothetical protein